MPDCKKMFLILGFHSLFCFYTALATTCEIAGKNVIRVMPAHPAIRVAKQDATVRLDCTWQHIHTVEGLQWWFNDKMIRETYYFTHSSETCRGNYSYIIDNFNSSNVGNYSCRVFTTIDRANPFEATWIVSLEVPTVPTAGPPEVNDNKSEIAIFLGPIIATVLVAMVIITALVAVKLRLRHRMILKEDYSNMAPPGRDGFTYDLFVSYRDSPPLLTFVLDKVKRPLQAAGYRVCHHKEDFIAGMDIAENITECLEQSRMVLVIISKDFTNSKWGMFELNYTIGMVYEDQTRRLIPATCDQKHVPRSLKNVTFLKIEPDDIEKSYTSGPVAFADRLIEILGDPIAKSNAPGKEQDRNCG